MRGEVYKKGVLSQVAILVAIILVVASISLLNSAPQLTGGAITTEEKNAALEVPNVTEVNSSPEPTAPVDNVTIKQKSEKNIGTLGSGMPPQCGGTTSCQCGDMIIQNRVFNLNDFSTPATCSGDGLIIGADNLVIDCSSRNINRTIYISSSIGINFGNHTGITLKNCNIKNYQKAMWFDIASKDINLTNMDFSDVGTIIDNGADNLNLRCKGGVVSSYESNKNAIIIDNRTNVNITNCNFNNYNNTFYIKNSTSYVRLTNITSTNSINTFLYVEPSASAIMHNISIVGVSATIEKNFIDLAATDFLIDCQGNSINGSTGSAGPAIAKVSQSSPISWVGIDNFAVRNCIFDGFSTKDFIDINTWSRGVTLSNLTFNNIPSSHYGINASAIDILLENLTFNTTSNGNFVSLGSLEPGNITFKNVLFYGNPTEVLNDNTTADVNIIYENPYGRISWMNLSNATLEGAPLYLNLNGSPDRSGHVAITRASGETIFYLNASAHPNLNSSANLTALNNPKLNYVPVLVLASYDDQNFTTCNTPTICSNVNIDSTSGDFRNYSFNVSHFTTYRLYSPSCGLMTPCTCGDNLYGSRTFTTDDFSDESGNQVLCTPTGMNLSALSIKVNNAVLDCNNTRKIVSDNFDFYSLEIANRNNVTVRNCEIDNFTGYFAHPVFSITPEIGVVAYASDNISLENLILSNNTIGVVSISSKINLSNTTIFVRNDSSTGVYVGPGGSANLYNVFVNDTNLYSSQSFLDINPGAYDNIAVENSNGRIEWTLSDMSTSGNAPFKFDDSTFKIQNNLIFLNSTMLPNYNTSANLTFKGITFNPSSALVAYDDSTFESCPGDVCSNVGTSGSNYYINVSHFTSFKLNESRANCGGSVPCDCGSTLTSSRTLNSQDALNGCPNVILNIGADNAVLDCNSSLIKGTVNTAGLGINISGRTNFTVNGCSVSRVLNGIIISNDSSNITINNSVFSNFRGIAVNTSGTNVYIGTPVLVGGAPYSMVGIYLGPEANITTIYNLQPSNLPYFVFDTVHATPNTTNLIFDFYPDVTVEFYNLSNSTAVATGNPLNYARNYFYLNTTMLPNLNKTAFVTFYNVSAVNPVAFVKDEGVSYFRKCTECSVVSSVGYKNWKFTTPHFSGFSLSSSQCGGIPDVPCDCGSELVNSRVMDSRDFVIGTCSGDALTINNPNTVLNCNNVWINTTSVNSNAININPSAVGSVIKNCNIFIQNLGSASQSSGILVNAERVNVSNTNITGYSLWGIMINSTNASVSNSNLSGQYYSILVAAPDAKVYNTYLLATDHAIGFGSTPDNFLYNFTGTGNFTPMSRINPSNKLIDDGITSSYKTLIIGTSQGIVKWVTNNLTLQDNLSVSDSDTKSLLINYNVIGLNSTMHPALNSSANLKFYDVLGGIESAQVAYDDENFTDCDLATCPDVKRTAGDFNLGSYSANVSHFTKFKIKAALCGDALPCQCGYTIVQSRAFNTSDFTATNCSGMNGLIIGADNLEIICNNRQIKGNRTGTTGVNFNGHNNITLQTCYVQNFTTAIMANTNNSRLVNINLLDNSSVGINLSGQDNVLAGIYDVNDEKGLWIDAISANNTFINTLFLLNAPERIIDTSTNNDTFILYRDTYLVYGVIKWADISNISLDFRLALGSDFNVVIDMRDLSYSITNASFIMLDNITRYPNFNRSAEIALKMLRPLNDNPSVYALYNDITPAFCSYPNCTVPYFTNNISDMNIPLLTIPILSNSNYSYARFNVSHFTQYLLTHKFCGDYVPCGCNMQLLKNRTFNNYDILNCTGMGLDFAADNLTLDCNEKTFIGDIAAGRVAFRVAGFNNAVIQNCNIYNYSTGMYFSGTSNTKIINSKINYTANATYLDSNSYVSFYNTSFINSQNYSIFDVSDSDWTYLSFENTYGKVVFNSSNLTSNHSIGLYPTVYPGIYLTDNLIQIKSSLYPALNKSAVVTLYNIPYAQTNVLVAYDEINFQDCPSCTGLINTSSSSWQFNVTDFTSYKLGSGNYCGGYTPCHCGYTLTSNRTFNTDDFSEGACTGDGLIIGADSIQLDCSNENTIQGSAVGVGINLLSHQNVNVYNCEIENFNLGLSGDSNGVNATFENLFLSNNTYGASLNGSHTLILSSLINNSQVALEIGNLINLFLVQNVIINNSLYGIISAHNGTVIELSTIDNTNYSITLSGSHNLLTNTSISNANVALNLSANYTKVTGLAVSNSNTPMILSGAYDNITSINVTSTINGLQIVSTANNNNIFNPVISGTTYNAINDSVGGLNNLVFYDTTYATVEWLNQDNLTINNQGIWLGRDVIISSNYTFVNSTRHPELNKTANLTFFGISNPIYSSPIPVVRDGTSSFLKKRIRCQWR